MSQRLERRTDGRKENRCGDVEVLSTYDAIVDRYEGPGRRSSIWGMAERRAGPSIISDLVWFDWIVSFIAVLTFRRVGAYVPDHPILSEECYSQAGVLQAVPVEFGSEDLWWGVSVTG